MSVKLQAAGDLAGIGSGEGGHWYPDSNSSACCAGWVMLQTVADATQFPQVYVRDSTNNSSFVGSFGRNTGAAGYSFYIQNTDTNNTAKKHVGGLGAWDANTYYHFAFCVSSRTVGGLNVYFNGSSMINTLTQDSGATPNSWISDQIYLYSPTATSVTFFAEWGFWSNYLLTQDNVDKLAGTNYGGNNASNLRYAPSLVQPSALVHYYDLAVGRNTTTDAGTFPKNLSFGGSAAMATSHVTSIIYSLSSAKTKYSAHLLDMMRRT